MPKVYVVNKGPHDYSPAREFGELVYLTQGTISKYDVGQMYRECAPILQRSTADDYILITSLTSLCVVACSIFAWRHGRLNLLLYKGNAYTVRTIVLDN